MFIVHISNINSPDTLVSLGIRERSQNEKTVVQYFEADLLKIPDFPLVVFVKHYRKRIPQVLTWMMKAKFIARLQNLSVPDFSTIHLAGNKMNASSKLGILLIVRNLSCVKMPLTILPLYQLVLLLLYHYLYSSVLMEQSELSVWIKHVW